MFWLIGISRPWIHFQHTVISFKSREESLKSFHWLINLFFLRWLNNPEWTDILQRLHRVIITLRCRLCCHSDRKSMWRKQMCAAAYVIKVHQYRIAPFLHVGLFTQQTWQQTGVTPGLQIISDSSRVTAQKVNTSRRSTFFMENSTSGSQPDQTVLPWCRNKAKQTKLLHDFVCEIEPPY